MAGGAAPPSADALVKQARLLHRQGRYAAALDILQSAGPNPDGSSPAPFLHAALLSRLGRVAEAIAMQRTGIAVADSPHARIALANMLRFAGDLSGSAREARAAIAQAPASGEAWWTLANDKATILTEDDRAAIRDALAHQQGDDFDRACLHFAQAYAHEQVGDWTAAWHHLSTANALRAAQVKHRPDAVTALVDATIEVIDKNFLTELMAHGEPSSAPIFIVGMPRSGSTLLERMLAASGDVEALGELPALVSVARKLGGSERGIGPGYLRALSALQGEQYAEVGRDYLEEAQPYRQRAAPRFTDKLPNNWLLTGLILTCLPNAHVIDIRRHPLDCGLSNFRENFARGQAYSYDLVHIGRYYSDYVRLMRHMEGLRPDRVYRVIYDRLVENPEAELRKLCAKLGLAFVDTMRRPEQGQAAVRTASAAQVRQPVDRRGIGTWHRYEDHLGPLIDALGPVLTDWKV